ncbi:MAG: hypothetical protein HOJ34_11420 [Kordiimonadaceae bacterium]|jgi:photosystem II stability/assembly factor-like uncharacterized protein|nr:hypothetical protein [Kordiimonadaceae bacterium]MBT6330382.1 hypothetical protein [Kordiimonadaceae bacterium]
MNKIIIAIAIFFSSFCTTIAQEGFNADLIEDWHWRQLGPALPAGRSWYVVADENNPKVIFATAAGGGLWKSDNNGVTFRNVFAQYNVASTGYVAVSKLDSDVVWLGTGENAGTRVTTYGDGVYKSTDGGETWKNMGLPESYHISDIKIHPTNPDIVYVAASGYLWGESEHKGIYKTTNGGMSWRKVLYIDEETGGHDIEFDPHNPDIMYASMWQRFRFGGGDMDDIGPSSGIYKTLDGGESWTHLTNGLPTVDMGKIHLVVAQNNSDILYAHLMTDRDPDGNHQYGIYRSEDGGASWTHQSTAPTRPVYYYSNITIDPKDDNTIWLPLLELHRSTDGGKTFAKMNMRHVHFDLHSLWINPADNDHMILSGDGGVNISFDGSKTWASTTLPIGQFYEVSVDNQDPYNVIGGMQDTGTWRGPSRTYDEEGITNSDWIKLKHNGDGMDSSTDRDDPNLIYFAQIMGGTAKLDLRTWERTEFRPSVAEIAASGLSEKIRYDWNPAFHHSYHDTDTLYLGNNYLMKINNKTADWKIISPDLTWQQQRAITGREEEDSMEIGFHSYGALFSVNESRQDADTIWTGSDDGRISITRDGGDNWTNLTGNLPADTPQQCVVDEIETSHFVDGRAYATLNCYGRNDRAPHVYLTDDFGGSWSDISGNLPTGPAYVVKEDPKNENVLYLGTEFGFFVTLDKGGRWVQLRGNLPTANVASMAIQERDMEVVVGTFGHAMWVTDIAPFSQMNADVFDQDLHIFDVPAATKHRIRVKYGNTIEELQGDNYFRGENPAYGASITYYLKDATSNGMVEIDVKDSSGNVVRTLSGPGQDGLNTAVWDLMSNEGAADNLPAPVRRLSYEDRHYRRLVDIGDYTVEIEGQTKPVHVRPQPVGAINPTGRIN